MFNVGRLIAIYMPCFSGENILRFNFRVLINGLSLQTNPFLYSGAKGLNLWQYYSASVCNNVVSKSAEMLERFRTKNMVEG